MDSQRFSLRIARADADGADAVSAALRWCSDAQMDMLILRVDCGAHEAVAAAERAGALLMDTAVTWDREVQQGTRVLTARFGRAGDALRAQELARVAFKGYPNHYRNDPALPREQVDAIHPSWAARLCASVSEREFVLFAQDHGHDVGFAAVAVGEDGMAEVPLFAVAPAAQSRGLGRHLLKDVLGAAASRGARIVRYTTHLHNLAAQRMLCACGFSPRAARHTFHQWFTP